MLRQISSAKVETLPTEDEYFNQIRLTSEIVWNNRLAKSDIELWLSNFKGTVFDIKYERQLALHLLANFVFFNEYEVRQLCRTLYRDFAHYILSENISGNGMPNLDLKHNEILYTTSFYHLGKPGESGAFLLYFFRQENGLPIRNFVSSSVRPPSYVNTIVFIDDVTISGVQAHKYLQRETINNDKDKTKILLTLISTDDAVKIIQKDGIKVISCITLDERNKCFHENSDLFHHYDEKIRLDCREFATTYGKECLSNYPFSCDPLGFDDGQYAFGFFYNTPDNTLPIFWVESEKWSPIIKRYEKSGEVYYGELGRFI